MKDRIHVGIVGGFDLAGNARTLLKNIRNLLSSRSTQFDCDLLLSEKTEPPEGFEKVPLNKSPTTARGKIYSLIGAIYRYVKTAHPDILLQITRFPIHGTAAALAGELTRTPTITRLAGEEFSEYMYSCNLSEKVRLFLLKNVIGQTAVHLSDAIIVLGPNARKNLATHCRSRNIWEIPQPVNNDRFSAVHPDRRQKIRKELNIPTDTRMLLTVGRVTRRKGSESISRVASELPSNIIWYVIGEGPMQNQLSTIPNVETVGRVPHHKMPDYYRAADLYVHPSLHDGLPNVLLEATACGTPSVARNVGECDSIAVETFEDDDELYCLLNQEYDSVELGDRFDDDKLAKQYETLLMEVAR